MSEYKNETGRRDRDSINTFEDYEVRYLVGEVRGKQGRTP